MNVVREHLDREQRSRLVAIIRSKLPSATYRELANSLNCSLGGIHELLEGGDVTRDYMKRVCEELGVSPYYILEGRGRRYADWREVFGAAKTPPKERYQNQGAEPKIV